MATPAITSRADARMRMRPSGARKKRANPARAGMRTFISLFGTTVDCLMTPRAHSRGSEGWGGMGTSLVV